MKWLSVRNNHVVRPTDRLRACHAESTRAGGQKHFSTESEHWPASVPVIEPTAARIGDGTLSGGSMQLDDTQYLRTAIWCQV